MKKAVTGLVMNFCFLLVQTSADAGVAEEILRDSGVKGGLVVHVGCGNGKITSALRANQGYLVQGLDPDDGNIASAKKSLPGSGLQGHVSFRQWSETYLPYADGVVNLIVVGEKTDISEEEMMRVLAPRGVLCMGSGKSFKKTVKPWPNNIDEWTHYLRDASGNAVAKDDLVGSPGRLQWNVGPRYSRNHEMDVSFVAMVSAKGKIFYLVDEGPLGVNDSKIPEKFFVVARDAFSGVLLWKHEMSNWGWRQWKPELSGRDWSVKTSSLMHAQRKLVPIGLPRRLVVSDDEVYISLDYVGPIVALDANTGKELRTYQGSDGTDEILFDDGKLLFCIREGSREAGGGKTGNNAGEIKSYDAKTGKLLWETGALESIFPMSLTSYNKRAFYHTGNDLVCLSAADGKKLWTAENSNARSERWATEHTLVAYKDAIIVATHKGINAFSAVDGSQLWQAGPEMSPRQAFTGKGSTSAPVNLFIMNDLLWVAGQGGERGKRIYSFRGLDPKTGEVKKDVPLPKYIYSNIHHFRCYRGKATERFLMDNKRGIEFLDIEGKEHSKNDWVRGICRYGIMPANGIIYSPPSPCSCYNSVQLDSFNALVSRLSPDNVGPERSPGGFVKGPAYDDKISGETKESDWPTFRGDMERSGSSKVTVSANATKKWEAGLGGKLTQPVVVGNMVVLASVDHHTVYALDADNGTRLWDYTVDARVDSPPTYHNGMLIFGCRNGWVYNLRAKDGKLVWKYRVAPVDRQIMSYEQLESTWPVHGSVLVMNDVVYAAAGRNTYLDGGIYMVGLDAQTGTVKYETIVKERHLDPETDACDSRSRIIRGAKNDVLISDGKYIYMQSKFFDMELKEVEQAGFRICTTSGLLNDSGWHRIAWKYTDVPTFTVYYRFDIGQIFAKSGNMIYGNEQFTTAGTWAMMHFPERDNCRLFAEEIKPPPKKAPRVPQRTPKVWETTVDFRPHAIVNAGDLIFAAGPPDLVDESDPLAAFEGRKGGIMCAVSTADGKVMQKHKLSAPPCFDGIVAANGYLYLSTMDGKLTCFK